MPILFYIILILKSKPSKLQIFKKNLAPTQNKRNNVNNNINQIQSESKTHKLIPNHKFILVQES